MHKRPFTTELLEARLLLSNATNAAIEKFYLSPAVFVENDGQWTDSSVRFVHQGQGASIAMTDRGPVFELYKDVTPVDSVVDDRLDDRFDSRFDDPIERSIESTRFSVSFNNSNITQPIGHNRSTTTFNYNIGTPDLHRSNVHGFEKIVYPDLYDGIDLHTWGQRDSLKYEFHVAPNIDYRQIKVQYEGVEDLWIDDRGRLHAELGNGFGEVIDDSPVIWQIVKGKRVDVAGRFKLLDGDAGGDAGGDAYTFELTGKFDPNLPLVIDPDLAWSSYVGGTVSEHAKDITIDTDGNIYLTGWTTSSNWVSGGFDSSFEGSTDGYVVKLSAVGEHLWSSYVGGISADYGNCITTDSDGNVYVAGGTWSSGWISGGFDTTHNGLTDAYVVKLNASGEHIWSTYLGGTSYDTVSSIAIDSSDHMYLSGSTSSSSWVSGGFDTSQNGDSDAFVVKLSTSGEHIWSSYCGGASVDQSNRIATDFAGDVYITGRTTSSDWVSGGFDTSYNGGSSTGGDAFVIKLSTTGEHLWSTYLGGTANDIGYGITTDTVGNVYVTGDTLSPGWVSGGYDTSLNGGFFDAFVVKLNTSGAHIWSTYVGGTSNDAGFGIAIDPAANVCMVGSTHSSDWVNGGFDTSYNGEADSFVVKLSATGDPLWSTYLGGTADDDGFGIAIDSAGNLYVMGDTGSFGWVSGGFDTTYNGGSNDAFIAKITDQSDITIPIFENSVFNYLTTSEQTLTATFDENISPSLAAADFVLTNLNTTTNIPLTLQSISTDGQSATFTFSATGNDLGGAILTDGHYRIRALAGQIEDASGNALASDVDHFFDFKNCDFAVEDTIVDFNDLLIIAQNYGTGPGIFFSQGDANYDGFVNFNDLLAVAQRYGSGIPELCIGRAVPTKSNRIIGDVFSADARIV